MFPLTVAAAALVLAGVGLARFLPGMRKRRDQVRFIRKTLAAAAVPDRRRVIASLSTVPDRIGNLQPTIRSLLNQTRPPDEIILVIPKFSVRENRPYTLPEYLSSLPRVRVLHCEKDWGPGTKFIPIVQEELAADRRNSQILVVDDDRIYQSDAIETYLYYKEQLPNAALCFRGAPLPASMDWRDARMVFGNELRAPKHVAVITGCGSYLIEPGFFDESLWNYSGAPEGAFYMDDIWISGRLAQHGIERYAVPASAMMRSVLRQRRTLSLHDVPIGRQYHNNETIAFFRDAWDIIAD